MKKTVAIFYLALISMYPLVVQAAATLDAGVSESCNRFYSKASSSFSIKNIRSSSTGKGYASFEMRFIPSVASLMETEDYALAFSCKKTTDPTWKSIPLEQLTATIDYNGTTKFRDKISDPALGEFGKLVSYAASFSEQEGRKKFAMCLSAAQKSPSTLSAGTTRYDATYEDGSGASFSCFRISGPRWSSYGLSMSNGFDFKKAELLK
jgi:hypothetical protein